MTGDHVMKSVLMTIWDHTLLVTGWLIVCVGVLITPLPIPFGLIMIIIGLSLLTWKSHFLRNQLRHLRRRYSAFSSSLERITPKLPRILRHAVELTEPHRKE